MKEKKRNSAHKPEESAHLWELVSCAALMESHKRCLHAHPSPPSVLARKGREEVDVIVVVNGFSSECSKPNVNVFQPQLLAHSIQEKEAA